MNRKVRIRTIVDQISYGKEYSGEVGFDEFWFNYHVVFEGGLDGLMKRSPEFIKSKIRMDVHDKEGKEVALDDDSRQLFITTAAMAAIVFYHHPHIRAYQEGIERLIEKSGKDVNLRSGMMSETYLPMIPPLEKFLGGYMLKNELKPEDNKGA